MLCLNLNFPVWFQMPGRGQDARPPGTPTAPHPRAEAARPPGHQRSSTAQRRPERGDASAVRREGSTGAVKNSFIMFYEKERCKIASPPLPPTMGQLGLSSTPNSYWPIMFRGPRQANRGQIEGIFGKNRGHFCKFVMDILDRFMCSVLECCQLSSSNHYA